jgi:predicted Fe-Mo cluster-binding NifX family protein
MRIAVSVWGERVSPVLDAASTIRVAETGDEDRDAECYDIRLENRDLHWRCSRICGLEIDTIICGAVSKEMSALLEASGIKVISGIAGNYDRVMEAYRDGSLGSSRFAMPGYDNG